MKYEKILLIDDDIDDQEIFLTALNAIPEKITCDVRNNALTALQHLTAQQITPDLIFLDLNMPIMNGQQFLKEIKANDGLKHIPVIIFSTSSYIATVKETMDLGAHKFITKPNRFNELVAIVKSIIQE